MGLRQKPITPFSYADSYKLSHWRQYPEGTTFVYSNITPRFTMRPKGYDRFVVFGIQAFLHKMHDLFSQTFFNTMEVDAMLAFSTFYVRYFGKNPTEEERNCVLDLHRLGYLPLRIQALPEGSVIPYGIPFATIHNTKPEFHWLTNFIESWMSSEVWLACTSATTSMYYRATSDFYAEVSSDIPYFAGFQHHDFSFRGMSGVEAAKISGAAHAIFSSGSDSCPVLEFIDDYYGGELLYPPAIPAAGPITSVPATEHSVMSAGGRETELQTYSRLLDLYPEGVLAVVSDTWDFWKVVTEVLPALKDKIMGRPGTLVIRPDSSPKTPVEIICGDPEADPKSPEGKGLVQVLYEIFGGTVNGKGYIQLDSHIGAIYGESITLERQRLIFDRLLEKKFASTNILFGVGSYTYQYVTRDTDGIAMKATCTGRRDFEGFIPIYKDPVTDKLGKKSARGLLRVERTMKDLFYGTVPVYSLKQDVETYQEAMSGAMHDVYIDGLMWHATDLEAIRAKAKIESVVVQQEIRRTNKKLWIKPEVTEGAVVAQPTDDTDFGWAK